jgi:CHAT domain-containing protein
VAELDDRPLVIVPTGELHAVPWALLPALRGRPVTVAPSATAWLRAAQRPERAGTVVLVVGPGLDGAAAEIDDLAARHPRAVCLSGPHATAEATLAAIDGADLVHVAAHGTFRSDNPLFSNLQLADGPLTVYDLERLRRAPRRLILSACDTGLSAVRPGDELMGLATALFALGTQTLIGSVVPVPDVDTHRLMLAVHDGLQAGASPARALADAQAAEDDRDDTNVASYAGFVCFGAG